MDLSPIGADILIAREGRRLTAYRDSKGIWTIGVGHTGAAGPPAVRPGLTMTAQECDALFARDVARFVRAVHDALGDRAAALPQHAFDALVSLCFNIGTAAFRRSTVVRRLRAGDREGAAEAILMWNRPAELIPRRRAEHDQFRTPYETAPPVARRAAAKCGRGVADAAPRAPKRSTVPSVGLATPTRRGWLARLKARVLGR